MYDLSIVIVSWNAKDFLVSCLQSIEDTRGVHATEVIVVDNASTDGSPEAVEQHWPQVRLVRNPSNMGFAKANNVGIGISTGRYVALVNSDVIVLPGCIDGLIHFMDAHAKVGLVGPRVLNSDRTLQPSCRRFPTILSAFFRAIAIDSLLPRCSFVAGSFMPEADHEGEQRVDAVSGAFCVARHSAVRAIGGLDEDFFMYSEDIDWSKRFHEAGWEVAYWPESRAIHFGGASSANAPARFFVEMQKAELLYWRKHFGQLGMFYFAAMLLLHQVIRLVPRAFLYVACPGRRALIAPKIERSLACLHWLVRPTPRQQVRDS